MRWLFSGLSGYTPGPCLPRGLRPAVGGQGGAASPCCLPPPPQGELSASEPALGKPGRGSCSASENGVGYKLCNPGEEFT